MTPIGSVTTKLIIIRGNSASGKTSAAWAIRGRHGKGLAIVSQDVIRRDISKDKDVPGNANIGLIDLTVQYALDHAFDVIVEGILHSQSYGAMLTELVKDHSGRTSCFYYDLPFEVTEQRHTEKAEAAEDDSDMMRTWYRECDLVPELQEKVFDSEMSLEDAVVAMMNAVGLHDRRE